MDYICECGTKTMAKKDGSPWKHQTPDGDKCSAYENRSTGERTDVPGVFSFSLNVYRLVSLPLLEDEGWHNENKKLAHKKAVEAGKTPMGEAVLVSKVDDGNSSKIVLTYEVPIKEG